MKIYRIWAAENIKTFKPLKDTEENHQACQFDGSIITNWTPVQLVAKEPYKNNIEVFTDLTFVEGCTPLISPKAFEIIYPHLKDFAQFFETTTDFGNMYLVNIFNVNNCVNLEKSEVEYFKCSGRLKRIEKYIFYEDRIKGLELFKIPEASNSFPFITEGLKNIIEENGLTGWRYELLFE